jgi:hypothetical protein
VGEESGHPQNLLRTYYEDQPEHPADYGYFWQGKFRGNDEDINDFLGKGNKGE